MSREKKNLKVEKGNAKSQLTNQNIEEPTELKVAKSNFRQAIIAALITSILAGAFAIIVAVINKQTGSSSDAEVQYIEQSIKNVLDNLKDRKNELSKAKEEVEAKIENEQNPEKRNELKEVKDLISDAIKSNEDVQEKVKEDSKDIITARKEGKWVQSRLIQKKVNEAISKDTGKIRRLKKKIDDSTIDFSSFIPTEDLSAGAGFKVFKKASPSRKIKPNAAIVSADNIISLGIINDKAIKLVKPIYPKAAKSVRA